MPSFDIVYVGFHAATMDSTNDYGIIMDAAMAVKNGHIAEVEANILGRNDGEYLVKAFDYAQGIVTGSVPGAQDGMPVRLAGQD